jgi:hypothetical protein
MPSQDPIDVLGYTQQHQEVLASPLARLGWKPQYDVYLPPKYDKRNKGEKSTYWGATLPVGSTWEGFSKAHPEEDVAAAMSKYIKTLAKDEYKRFAESDQTVYINEASKRRALSTAKHESTHRAIIKLVDQYWGGRLGAKDNEMLATLIDYKYGNTKQKEYSRKRLGWISGLIDGKTKIKGKIKDDITDAEVKVLQNEYSGWINELEAHAIAQQPTAFKGSKNAK